MNAPPRYRIRFGGHLDAAWSEWFAGLTVTPEPDGTTTLTGPVPDQAALYGLLNRLRDLGAPLLAAERLTDRNVPAAGPSGGAKQTTRRAANTADGPAENDDTARGPGARAAKRSAKG